MFDFTMCSLSWLCSHLSFAAGIFVLIGKHPRRQKIDPDENEEERPDKVKAVFVCNLHLQKALIFTQSKP